MRLRLLVRGGSPELAAVIDEELLAALDGGGRDDSGSDDDSDDDENFRVLKLDWPVQLVGKGANKTKIRGGIKIVGVNSRFASAAAKVVILRALTVSYEEDGSDECGPGVTCKDNSLELEMQNCVVKECSEGGVVSYGATIRLTECEVHGNQDTGVSVEGGEAELTNCTVHHNAGDGIKAGKRGQITVRGDATDVHHNEGIGLLASGKGAHIKIYLPEDKEASHDNDHTDEKAKASGKISRE